MLFVLVAFFQAFDLTNVTELLNALLKALSSWYCQLDCEHHSAACRGRSVTLVGAGGWWPDPQLD